MCIFFFKKDISIITRHFKYFENTEKEFTRANVHIGRGYMDGRRTGRSNVSDEAGFHTQAKSCSTFKLYTTRERSSQTYGGNALSRS